MGIISTIMGFIGFGMGITIGLVIGYYLFIYLQPTDVEDPIIRPLVEQDTKTLERMVPEIPIWIKNPDHDRVDWLNKFIEYMWPYLDKAICNQVKTIATPIIAEQIPKYKIEAVEFEALTLGCLPPTFQGMKVFTTDEKEIIMEPSLKWAGNPNVLVAVKAFGLKATVQVVDLQVFASPRVTLKKLHRRSPPGSLPPVVFPLRRFINTFSENSDDEPPLMICNSASLDSLLLSHSSLRSNCFRHKIFHGFIFMFITESGLNLFTYYFGQLFPELCHVA